MAPRIEACIVNHNTSVFTELALRSLAATHRGWLDDGRLRVTVVDNHSNDDGLNELRAACRELDAGFELSRWPLTDASPLPVNSHGDVLRDFVAARREATQFLFVDTDTYFLTNDSVGVMLGELTAEPDIWAVQARFAWVEDDGGPGASYNIWSGRVQQLRTSIDGAVAGPFPGEHKPRCQPGLALIANTPVFRRVADIIGLSAGVTMAADESIAGFADTLGPATLVMATHELRHVLSAVTVGHYHCVTYPSGDNPLDWKLDDCHRRLAELRQT
jgi:hypothetical protein